MQNTRIKLVWCLSVFGLALSALAAGAPNLQAKQATVSECENNACSLDDGQCKYVAPAQYNCRIVAGGSCVSSGCNVE